MDENDIVTGVYVELDSIMDTRLSILYDIDKGMIENRLTSGLYHKRYMDQFDYISVRLFRTLYKLRNSNVLDNPSPTEMIKVIDDYCYESNITNVNFEHKKPVTIHLNIYPYNLSEENIELIRMGLSNSMRSNVNVEILYLAPSEVTPSFMNSEISLAIMYDALSWVEYHMQNKNLINRSIPDVMLMTPMLIHRKLLIKENELPKFFEDIEKNLAMIVNIVFIPTKFFSVIKKETTTS